MNAPAKQKNTRDVALISAAFFFAFIGTGASQPFIIDYVAEAKSIPREQASLVLATVYFSFLFFRFFSDYVIRFLGVHRAKIIGAAAYALFPLLVRYAPSLPWLLAGSCFWGLGAMLLWNSSLVQVMNTSAPERYSASTGYVRGTVVIANFLGAYLLSFIYARRGYEILLYAAALLGAAGIIFMLLSPRRVIEVAKPHPRRFIALMREGDPLLVGLLFLCSAMAYGIVLNGIKGHIEAVNGKFWLEWTMPAFWIAGIVANFGGGRYCDRAGRWPVMIAGFTVGAAGMLLLALSLHPLVIMAALACLGFQLSIVPLSVFGWIGDRAGHAERTAVVGYIFCFNDLGVALSIQMRGLFPSVPAAAWAFFAIYLCCAIAALVVHMRK